MSGARERVLVLGAGGLLGHKLLQLLTPRFDTWGTVRSRPRSLAGELAELFQSPRVVDGVDATDWGGLARVLQDLRPTVVLNAIGAIKQRAEAADPATSITLNALLPHQLALLIGGWEGRLIHFSTDCVFSGARGGYREDDVSDAVDLYGRSKYLGEVTTGNGLTLRTSFIGREIHHHQSLLDWLLSQNHRSVRGFTRALWSGVTSNHLAGIVSRVIVERPALRGLFHVAGDPISKHDLLVRLRDGLGLDIDITPDDSVVNDRTLESGRFVEATGHRPPSWDKLIAEIAADQTPYGMEWS